jgi:membrane-bound lytic murein transglycosylase D
LYWHIKWFKDNPDHLTRVTKRAGPYLHLVVREVEKAGLPIELALLPIIESAYYPFSYSHGTASGLWQFIPDTGKLYGLKQNYWVDERRSVIHSTRSAVKYLKDLHALFKGDWLLAIASYNSVP